MRVEAMLGAAAPRRLSVPKLDLERVKHGAGASSGSARFAAPGLPAERALKGPVAIVLSQFCERIAFYGISAVLVSYAIRALRFTAGQGATLLLVWQGVCYLSPLLSSWIADHVLGRFSTILWWSLPYALGLALLTLSALLPHTAWLAYVALALVALGQVQVNVITFGADQFADDEERSAAQQQSYFNWFFFAINAGALLAFTIVAYLAQEVALVLGFLLPLLALLGHALAFVLGRRWYRMQAPSPSQSIVVAAFTLLVRVLRAPRVSTPTAAAPSPWWTAALSLRLDGGTRRAYSRAELLALVRFVHSLPVQLTFIIFWCIWSQTSSVFVAQSTVLNLRVLGVTLPVAGLNVFNTAAIVLLTPLFDRVLYPALRRLRINFGTTRRILAGYVIVLLAVLYAGVLERYRRGLVAQGHTIKQSLGRDATGAPVVVVAAELSILAQAPAFVLIGVGEILAAISGTEYSYAALPHSLRSTAIAIFWTTSALGTFLGAALVAAVTAWGQWFTSDLNASRLDAYYFLLAVLGALNVLVLVLVTRYEPALPHATDDSDDDDTDSLHETAVPEERRPLRLAHATTPSPSPSPSDSHTASSSTPPSPRTAHDDDADAVLVELASSSDTSSSSSSALHGAG